MKRKFYIKTFGCQMNELDSDRMSGLLCERGWERVPESFEADLIIFNTCTVREKPHHKAISEVGRALKLKKKRKDIMVGITGCVAQEEETNLFSIYPDLDFIVGPDQISHIAEIVKKIAKDKVLKSTVKICSTDLINDCDEYKFISLDSRLMTQDSRPVTSFVKISKGCNNFCTFCIVPYVRGREVSRDSNDIIDEVKALSENGIKEITLLGQNVNSYGNDREECLAFPDLIRAISDETGISRIRYTSPHPKDVSDELIEEHRSNGRLCKHIHLPLQAGSSEVLRRMNRRYSKDDYLALSSKIRQSVPDIAVTTDIIAGFPGETDDDFNDTLDVMEKVQFDGIYAFKYSTRPGTKAAKIYNDDVPDQVKADRLSQVLTVNERIVLKKHEKYVGTTQIILVEGKSKRREDQQTGRTSTNKIVNFEADEELVGNVVEVKITAAGLNSLKGRVKC